MSKLDHIGHLYQVYLLKYDAVSIWLNIQPKREKKI